MVPNYQNIKSLKFEKVLNANAMMQKLSLLSIFILVNTSVAFSQFRFQDTSFLMRDIRKNYEAYYIAELKDSLSYLSMTKSCKIAQPSVQTSNNFTPAKYSITDYFGCRLFQLHIYNNQLYLYLPSDNIESQYFLFSDTKILWEAASEVDTMRISNMSISSDSAMITANGQLRPSLQIQLHNTNWPNVLLIGINETHQKQHTIWSLWVQEKYLRQFPLLVHLSPSQKAFTEFTFDPINADKVIRHARHSGQLR
jgi:hypothetical protein